ncbi:MAG: dephospho-CoA kinase [Phycisphaerales bacterium]|nr:dephospho-CoA kinase [Phycisphaerales bacterium]MDG1979759.1 dephospho-CoA kinase [Phycisphaerales bacterium]
MNGAHRVPVIGLAGGIGAGKSAVASVLASAGCVISDSDRDAAKVLADPAVVETLRSWWGDEVLAPGGVIDRSVIAARIFGDDDARRRLESLVHPAVHRLREARFAAAPADVTALVIDAPLLFEAGLAEACDAVFFVDAPWASRLARVTEHRGWDESELRRREAAQLPIEEKRRRATRVIDNDGDLAVLESAVVAALRSVTEGG